MSVGRGMFPLTLPGVGTKEKEIKDKGLEYKQKAQMAFRRCRTSGVYPDKPGGKATEKMGE